MPLIEYWLELILPKLPMAFELDAYHTIFPNDQ